MAEKGAEFITNMLQEMRALGVAIILIDQTPSALPVSVLKATATKLVGRQVEGHDRQIIVDCMMLTAHQRDDLTQLRPGDFYLFGESYPRAIKIRVPDIYQKISLPFADELLGEKILKHISKDKWFLDCQQERIFAELKLLATEIDGFFRKAENLMISAAELLLTAGGDDRPSFTGKIVKLCRVIDNLVQAFHKNRLLPLAGLDNNTVYVEPHKSFRDNILSQFETLKTRLSVCQAMLEKHKNH
ncbi:MAG: ATP-binding protein [Planctomycetes bacterium]|nr:ATP-binding protein [Planctomycetota bacterium]